MFRNAILPAVLILGAVLPAGSQVRSNAAIDPQDRLVVKVLEWLPAKGEYKEWTAVGGNYLVGSDGVIDVPFAGEVSSAGLSPAELGRAIATSLQRNLSLPMKPEVNVEVASRSPVYVIGGVETPGKFEFTPGLTAINAVALAGGFYRGGGGDLRLERDVINAEGDLDAAKDNSARLVARVARLGAELDETATVKLAADAPNADTARPFLAEEQQLMDVRRQARESQLTSLRSRRQLAIDQLKSLDEKSANLERQVTLAREQLGGVESLVGKGLTVASRRFELERTLSEIEGQVLDLQNSRLAAQLEINEAERQQAVVTTQFKIEVANDLQAARTLLSRAQLEISRGEQLVREATVIAPEKLIDRSGNFEIGIRFYRTRTVNGLSSTTEIRKDDPLLAGDTLQVQMESRSADVAGRSTPTQ